MPEAPPSVSEAGARESFGAMAPRPRGVAEGAPARTGREATKVIQKPGTYALKVR